MNALSFFCCISRLQTQSPIFPSQQLQQKFHFMMILLTWSLTRVRIHVRENVSLLRAWSRRHPWKFSSNSRRVSRMYPPVFRLERQSAHIITFAEHLSVFSVGTEILEARQIQFFQPTNTWSTGQLQMTRFCGSPRIATQRQINK
jgi:hypothetical protein